MVRSRAEARAQGERSVEMDVHLIPKKEPTRFELGGDPECDETNVPPPPI